MPWSEKMKSRTSRPVRAAASHTRRKPASYQASMAVTESGSCTW